MIHINTFNINAIEAIQESEVEFNPNDYQVVMHQVMAKIRYKASIGQREVRYGMLATKPNCYDLVKEVLKSMNYELSEIDSIERGCTKDLIIRW